MNYAAKSNLQINKSTNCHPAINQTFITGCQSTQGNNEGKRKVFKAGCIKLLHKYQTAEQNNRSKYDLQY